MIKNPAKREQKSLLSFIFHLYAIENADAMRENDRRAKHRSNKKYSVSAKHSTEALGGIVDGIRTEMVGRNSRR